MMQPKLSSDLLERQFGPTKVEILRQEADVRIICTKAIATGLLLELSLVHFIPSGILAYPVEHSSVVAGKSMGKAFRDRGIEFKRVTTSACRATLPSEFSQRYGDERPAPVVLVDIFVGPNDMPYAQIFETYRPDVSWPGLDSSESDEMVDAIESFNKMLASVSLGDRTENMSDY